MLLPGCSGSDFAPNDVNRAAAALLPRPLRPDSCGTEVRNNLVFRRRRFLRQIAGVWIRRRSPVTDWLPAPVHGEESRPEGVAVTCGEVGNSEGGGGGANSADVEAMKLPLG